jgi:hypothetical protein
MNGIDDLLLLVGFQSSVGCPISSFRCSNCGRSETFADDDHWGTSLFTLPATPGRGKSQNAPAAVSESWAGKLSLGLGRGRFGTNANRFVA